ncbi:MAG: PepSY domain-containing protein, partial [Bacteroidota bacterium]
MTLSATTALAGAQGASVAKLNSPDSSILSSNTRTDARGVVRASYNINSNPIAGSAEQIARTYLQQNGDAFQILNPAASLRTDQVQSVAGSSHVRFTQTYEGIPIFRGDVVVSINDANQVSMVINNAKTAISLGTTTPSISEASAIQIARQRVGIKGRTTGRPDNAALMVYCADAGPDHLAYRVSMTNEDPMGDWEVFVDAVNGNTLSVEDLFVNEYVQGSGHVYLSDPLSAARRMYNSTGFTDANDTDTDSLTAYRTQVTLDSLTFEGGVYKLKGPYCNVTDVESPSDPQFYAAPAPNAFNYTRSQQEFEAVNVYYNVTTAYKHLLDLG